MEEVQDFSTQDDGDQDHNVQQKVQEAEAQELELRQQFILKEKEARELYKDLRNVNEELWKFKERLYQIPIKIDPFLAEYLNELGDEHITIKSPDIIDEENRDKEKETLLKKFEEINQSQKPPIEFFKTLNDVHIGFRQLVEDLNNQIFKCHLDRVELEEEQNAYQKQIKSLRGSIKEVTERNEKIIKEIDNIKSRNL